MDSRAALTELVHGKRLVWWIFGFLIFFAVGSVGHHVPTTYDLMLILTPWFLLVFGMLALVPIAVAANLRFFVWALGAFVFTFTLEALGVASGDIFGAYSYGSTLGRKVFAVPLVIGFNWVLIVTGMNALFENLRTGWLVKSILSATGAVLFDLVLEPVAIRLDYWSWEGIKVPIQYYAAWWIIAFIISIAFHIAKVKLDSKVPWIYAGIQTLFIVSLLPLAFG